MGYLGGREQVLHGAAVPGDGAAAVPGRLFLLFYRHHEDEYAKIRYNHSAGKALVHPGVLHRSRGGCVILQEQSGIARGSSGKLL